MNHIYRFGNQIKLQSTGGPIGLALTGEVADCFMNKWDKLFLQKCKDMNIDSRMYSRFKDDIFVSALSLEKGTNIVDGKLVVDMKVNKKKKTKKGVMMILEIVKKGC